MDLVETLDHNQETDNKTDRYKKAKRVLTILALQATLFLSALDATIVSTSLPRIGSDFGEYNIAIWVANAYYLSLNAFLPLFSMLNDVFGRKSTLLIGISIFLLGSLLCGIASSMIMLIVCRAIAGIGASGIDAAVYVIISEMAPLDKRGNFHVIINAVFAVSSVMGPLVGGSLTDNLNWRWCFYINLPIGLSSLLLLVFFYDLPSQVTIDTDNLKRIDYAGTFSLTSANVLFLLALNFGGDMYPWISAAVLVPLALSVVLLCIFVLIEDKFARNPIIPLRYFKNRSFVANLLTTFWLGVCMVSFVYFFPVFLQTIKGDSAMWSGIRLIPMQLTICIASTIAGYLITKTGLYRPGLWMGMLLLVALYGLISIFNVTTPYYQIYMVTITGGTGLGFLLSSTIISQQATSKPEDISIVTGLNHLILFIGGSIGIAIANSVLTTRLAADLPSVVPPEYVQTIIKSPLFVHNGLPQQYRDTVLRVFNSSIQMIWYIMILLATLGLITSFFIKHYDLRAPHQDEPIEMNQYDKKEHGMTQNITTQSDRSCAPPIV